ncbi:MAG: FAD-binding protein [Selenomonas sp.]|jgi:glycolate oxidase|nr:FAD-binding protein [Selenomonas sp.]
MTAYKKLEETDLQAVASFIARDRILWNQEINEEYSHDELSSEQSYPDMVVRVTSAEEVSRLMAYANQHHIAVTPRGAGTGAGRCLSRS